MNNSIYYISQYDNRVHNINDVQHKIVDEKYAYVGKDCGEDGFRVDEEVTLWSLSEIIVFFEE